MKGKQDLLRDIADGKVKATTVEVVEIGQKLPNARRVEVKPDDGRIGTAYPDLVPLEAVVRWIHPAEVKVDPKTGAKNYRDAQNGHVWMDKGEPVVVHGACFGIFRLADVIVLSDGTEPGLDGASNVPLE